MWDSEDSLAMLPSEFPVWKPLHITVEANVHRIVRSRHLPRVAVPEPVIRHL